MRERINTCSLARFDQSLTKLEWLLDHNLIVEQVLTYPFPMDECSIRMHHSISPMLVEWTMFVVYVFCYLNHWLNLRNCCSLFVAIDRHISIRHLASISRERVWFSTHSLEWCRVFRNDKWPIDCRQDHVWHSTLDQLEFELDLGQVDGVWKLWQIVWFHRDWFHR